MRVARPLGLLYGPRRPPLRGYVGRQQGAGGRGSATPVPA